MFVQGRSFETASDGVLISDWDVHITALTNKKRNLEILNQVVQEYPDLASLRNGIQIGWDKQFQQIKLFPLFGTAYPNQANFVVITNVTRAVKNIHQSIWNIALIGLAGLVISEILFLILFSRLLSRLTDVAFSCLS